MSKRSYLIFFPGAGNRGFGLGPSEIKFMDALRFQTGGRVDITYIYPYGGLEVNNLDVIIDAAEGKDNDVTEKKADQIDNYIRNGSPLGVTVYAWWHCYSVHNEDYDEINSEVKLNFLGYSGGGQIAYTTAQKLSGRLFVDNLIMVGPTWQAYNGVNNIGHIWEIWAKGDLDFWFLDLQNNLGGLAYDLMGWRAYNGSYLDIYQRENVHHETWGDANTDHNSYFSTDIKMANGKSMQQQLIDYLIYTVGIE